MDDSNEGFEEALARALQTDSEEMLDHQDRVDQRVESTKRDVAGKREKIRRGGQIEVAKRFRP